MGQRGGLLYRTRGAAHAGTGGELSFMPSDLVVGVTTLSAVTRIPGSRAPFAGIALADGKVVTVLELGSGAHPNEAAPGAPPRYLAGSDWPIPGSDGAVLCDVDGQVVAITGGEVVATGVFDEDGDAVLWGDARVRELDFRALYAQAEAAMWAARAIGPAAGEVPR